MPTLVTLTATGLGLGGLYFLLAAGLALIFGLMGVLNFAHGAFLTVGSYASWWSLTHLRVGGSTPSFVLAVAVGLVVGALVAGATEYLLIRPLYGRPLQQVLVTVGLAFVLVALVSGIFGTDARAVPLPGFLTGVTHLAGADIPHTVLVMILAALVVLLALEATLRRTRLGVVIRAGVENRAMVTALGIDVRRAFTAVFVIGGVAAALGGALTGAYDGSIDPTQGSSALIFAIVVVVIGGLGSIGGAAIAAALVGLVQQYVNFYAAPGVGDLAVMLLLAAVLLVRPGGVAGVVT